MHINVIEWLLGDDTGLSSKTIVSVMMGAQFRDPSPPYDPSDLGRCFRLLRIFPEWRLRLKEVSDLYPEWTPLVDNWDELERLFLKEWRSGRAPKLYERMKQLLGDD